MHQHVSQHFALDILRVFAEKYIANMGGNINELVAFLVYIYITYPTTIA